MSRLFALIVPYKQFQPGVVLEPGALLGETLVRNSKAIVVSRDEVRKLARKAGPGALPRFPQAALDQLVAQRQKRAEGQ